MNDDEDGTSRTSHSALMMSWGRNSYPGLCNYNSHRIHVCLSLHLQKNLPLRQENEQEPAQILGVSFSMLSPPNGSLNLCILPNCMNIVYFCFIYMLYYRYFVIFQESNCSSSTIPIPFGDPCDFVIFVLHQSSIRHHQPQKGVKLWLIVINYLFFLAACFHMALWRLPTLWILCEGSILGILREEFVWEQFLGPFLGWKWTRPLLAAWKTLTWTVHGYVNVVICLPKKSSWSVDR